MKTPMFVNLYSDGKGFRGVAAFSSLPRGSNAKTGLPRRSRADRLLHPSKESTSASFTNAIEALEDGHAGVTEAEQGRAWSPDRAGVGEGQGRAWCPDSAAVGEEQ